MTRLMMLTFFGKQRWAADAHPHESPWVMVVPLVVLAAGSAVLGMLLNTAIQHWLAPPTGGHPHDSGLLEVPWQGWLTLVLVVVFHQRVQCLVNFFFVVCS